MTPHEAARAIIRRLRAEGFTALLAGGCVRDLALGREPHDFDVATDARPAEVASLFEGSLLVGAAFGVALVPAQSLGAAEGFTTEVATFRRDGLYGDGRRPDAVEYAQSPEEDALRRDFTINGMYLDPLVEGAEPIDHVGGLRDLRAGVIRAIGDAHARIGEDRLRMLRAVRFAARFGFAVAPETFDAIAAHAPEIVSVSMERRRDELTRMLTEGHARRAFELLRAAGLIEGVLPEVARFVGVEQPPRFHPEGDVWNHTMLLLDGLGEGVDARLAWASLLHDVGKPAACSRGEKISFRGHAELGARIAEEMLRRFRFSNADRAAIVDMIACHMQFFEAAEMRASDFKRLARRPEFDAMLELHRLDCLASSGGLESYDAARRRAEATPPGALRPQALVNGRDILALGVAPGPRVSELLRVIEDAQLDEEVCSRQDALRLAQRLCRAQSPSDKNAALARGGGGK